ncbi:meteorin-like protein [Prorops nasuta]|uniref:meteorin-like protein n=1 Tax=Prorops nasuta TaxID=863751 RepID=UPI0034CEA332
MTSFGLIVFATATFLATSINEVSLAPTHAQWQFMTLPADQCDWTGSGGGGRGVRPVYLRCSRGTVLWRYPRGALRVVLLRSQEGPRGFRACVKASGPIRVYLESKNSLRPIYSPRDGKHEALHRCFYTQSQMTALYVEADEPSNIYSKARLQYDLEPMAERKPGELDDEAECRPCSKEELAKAYCQSDLVARGTVSAVQRKPDLESTELVLRVTKILRRVENYENNEVISTEPYAEMDIRVRVPTACDARHGQGEFVIMAKKRLGDLTLACAPRLEAWAEAVRELQSAPCVLKS